MAALLPGNSGIHTVVLENHPGTFPPPKSEPDRLVRAGLDFQEPEKEWRSLYGIGRGGFVIVRPD